MDRLLSFDDIPACSLGRVLMDTRQTLRCHAELDSLVTRGRTQNNAFALQLAGPARCGKTSTMKQYLRYCRDGVGGRNPVKYLWAELPATTDARNITNLTLRALGDPNPSKGDAMSRLARVEEAIVRRGYGLLVFDEAHHLVDSKTQSVQEDGVQFLNMLLNRTSCPIVLIGYDTKLGVAVGRNPSLAGRMWPCAKFRPYEVADPDDMSEFRCILRELERFMALPAKSGLWDRDTAARIMLVCKGRLGLLEMYLQYAWELSQRGGHSCLTRDDLRQAADTVAASSAEYASANPFEAPSVEVAVLRDAECRTASAAASRKTRR